METYVQKSKKEKISGVKPLKEDGTVRGSTPVFGGTRLEETITIGQPVDVVYTYWRDFTHLPRFCKYLTRVEILDARHSRWTVAGPGDKPLTWDAVLIEDLSNQLISWESEDGSEFENAGSVRFSAANFFRCQSILLDAIRLSSSAFFVSFDANVRSESAKRFFWANSAASNLVPTCPWYRSMCFLMRASPSDSGR